MTTLILNIDRDNDFGEKADIAGKSLKNIVASTLGPCNSLCKPLVRQFLKCSFLHAIIKPFYFISVR